jgi:predicted membrane-bound dolichyl-phosphate-mannose-protein mannosyltransferase
MKNYFPLFLIIFLYLSILAIFEPKVFSYRFDKKLIDRYLCSQDIPYEPPCKRLFLSDGEIHIAAGYLYVKGADPINYNFQHTPFLKYLYGLTILLTKNPFYLEVILGALFLSLTYFLSLKIFKSKIVSLFTSLFLAIDPLMITLSADAVLELGQACLLLLYLYGILFKKDDYIFQGIFLGLFAAAKFWGAVPFFVAFSFVYKLIKKEFNLKNFILHLLVGFFVFSLTYLKTFINHQGIFNIFFFQLKLVKYWMQHSVTNFPFASLILFLTGFYKSWWGDYGIVRSPVWSILWPVSFIVSLVNFFVLLKRKRINLQLFVSLLPIAYLFYLGVQAPFPRYFILILPFFYMTLANYLVVFLSKIKKIRA